MNRRRELALQRVSRIGGLADAEGAAWNKGRPVGMLTIEAAIGAYMTKNDNVYDLRSQRDSYIQISQEPDRQQQDQLSRQMAEYMSELEESHLTNAKPDLENRNSIQKLNKEKMEKALENDPSARYQLSHYGKNSDESESAFDKLDVNRCSGFLLYSYNKKGVHSVLGEHISPGRTDPNKRGKLWIQSI